MLRAFVSLTMLLLSPGVLLVVALTRLFCRKSPMRDSPAPTRRCNPTPRRGFIAVSQ
jgi:hypothetical protein